MANVNNSNFSTNMSTNSYQQIGGIAYFLLYMSDYLPYVIIVSSGTVIGIIGNIIIMGTIIINKELHSATYILMFNLSLADIVISGFVDTFTVVGVFAGKPFFDERKELCSFIGATCLIACITSLVNIGFLSINRYIHICHSRSYKKVFSTKLTLLYCLITWVVGVLIDLPNFTGWGGHYYDDKTLNCFWDRLASQSYSIFFPMSSIVIPCLAILFCYIKIFIYTYKSKNRSHCSNKTQSIRLAQGLFASFMLFTICWLPYGLVVMTDFQDKLPRSALMFTMTFAHLNSSLNPILYAIFNSSFRRGYAILFNKIFCCFGSFCKLTTNKVSNERNSYANTLTNNQALTLHKL